MEVLKMCSIYRYKSAQIERNQANKTENNRIMTAPFPLCKMLMEKFIFDLFHVVSGKP